MPYIAGCEIRDNPYNPLCRRCRDLIAQMEEATPIAWLTPADRYIEKLATPDVTVADLIGDMDPIRAARGGHDLSSELTMHYGLLPRANRGIFAINELPDLAGKIQVALFNILEEGDVQLKGYPVRLALDVALVFSANPEDYTARGKIVTPLKDRIGSEVRTHYPQTLDEGIAITAQETWSDRGVLPSKLPTTSAKSSSSSLSPRVKIKKWTGAAASASASPSPRWSLSYPAPSAAPLSTKRTSPSPASPTFTPRIPGITGKLELEYEGEMKGPAVVVNDLIPAAIPTFTTSISLTKTRSKSSNGSTSAAISASPTPCRPPLRTPPSQKSRAFAKNLAASEIRSKETPPHSRRGRIPSRGHRRP